jgi:hypothetical protein
MDNWTYTKACVLDSHVPRLAFNLQQQRLHIITNYQLVFSLLVLLLKQGIHKNYRCLQDESRYIAVKTTYIINKIIYIYIYIYMQYYLSDYMLVCSIVCYSFNKLKLCCYATIGAVFIYIHEYYLPLLRVYINLF